MRIAIIRLLGHRPLERAVFIYYLTKKTNTSYIVLARMRIAIIRLLGQSPLERAVFHFNAARKVPQLRRAIIFSSIVIKQHYDNPRGAKRMF